jgi:hypothetical protein
MNAKPEKSASGKTLVVASTYGNEETDCVVDGKKVIVGVNAYILKKSGEGLGGGYGVNPITGKTRRFANDSETVLTLLSGIENRIFPRATVRKPRK